MDFNQLNAPLEQANDIFVLLPQTPNLDQIAAGLTLYSSLKNSGKNVSIACPTQMSVEFSRLFAVDKIATKIGNRNLVISFDYVKDAIEKVSYNIEEEKFNLVVQPKANQKPLDSESVSYSYSGAVAELVFIIGASRLEDLADLYASERKLFTDATTVSIHRLQITPFAKINLHEPKINSLSQIVYHLMGHLKFPLTNDLATNILAGIDHATNKFQNPNISADTFAVASQLLQAGAKRQAMPSIQPQPFQPPTRLKPTSSQAQPTQPVFKPMTQTQSAQIPPHPANQTQPQPKTQTPPTPPQPQPSNQSVPKDWMQPKIFKGSTKV